MGLRVKPSGAAKAGFTKGDSAASKESNKNPVRGAGGRMQSNPAKGSTSVKPGSRPRTLGRIANRAGGTKAGGR